VRTRLGTLYAYLGTLGGLGLSVAANIQHAYLPPQHGWKPTAKMSEWQPPEGALITAAIWPLAVFVALEVFSRCPMPGALRWAGFLPVATISAVISYRHMSAVLRSWHDDVVAIWAGPMVIDGLMILCASALIVSSSAQSGTGFAVWSRLRSVQSEGSESKSVGSSPVQESGVVGLPDQTGSESTQTESSLVGLGSGPVQELDRVDLPDKTSLAETSLAETSLAVDNVVHMPVSTSRSKVWVCTCSACGSGGREVSKATYYNHRKQSKEA